MVTAAVGRPLVALAFDARSLLPSLALGEPAVIDGPHSAEPARKLLDRLGDALRERRRSRRTARTYGFWVRRFVLFHRRKHPALLGSSDIAAFLSALAADGLAAATRSQALAALRFLYRHVLGIRIDGIEAVPRAMARRTDPIILSRGEVAKVISVLDDRSRLIVMLLYGAGLRPLECLRLRVRDIDLEVGRIFVRAGTGKRHRFTLLPRVTRRRLRNQIDQVCRLHAQDLAHGAGWVELPPGLQASDGADGRDPAWQWLFPATKRYFDARTGQRRRHHYHESALQRALRDASAHSRLATTATALSFRNAFAIHHLEDGEDRQTVRRLLGDPRLPALRTYALSLGRRPPLLLSPLDRLPGNLR